MRLILLSILSIISISSFGQDLSEVVFEKDDLPTFKESFSSEDYQDAFHRAVSKGSNSILSFLIPQIDINAVDSMGNSGLISAVRKQDLNTVNLLLENKADPNVVQTTGLLATPLMFASSRNENSEIVIALLDNGANINAIDKNGDPAINWASYYGNTTIMKLLIDQGADLSIKSKHGLPIDVVYRLWHADSVAAVFRNAGYGIELSKMEKEVVAATRNGDIVRLEKYFTKGVSANTKDQLGNPLIHIAAETGNIQVMSLLIGRGANLKQLNRVGQSALCIASRFGHSSLVDFLLKNNADPNLSGEDYQLTPLIAAAVGGSNDVTQSLIKAGAVLDQTDVVNKSAALHWAMFYGNDDVAKTLIESGASLELPALDDQLNAMQIATAMNNEKLKTFISRQQNPMLGSWAIEAIHYIYADTTYKIEGDYHGRLLVADSTYSIMYNPYMQQRKSPDSLSKMTDEEKIYSFHTAVFNSGSYVIEDSTFITTASIAKVAGFEGGIQYYRIGKDDEAYTFTMFDETYPSGDKPEWYGKVRVRFLLRRE